MPRLSYQRVVIENGASTSDEIDLREFRLVGIQGDVDWTAADITFNAAARPDNAGEANPQFDPVYDSAGDEVVITAAADRYISFTSAHVDALEPLTRVKIRSGVVSGYVNQGADRTLTLILEHR